MEDSIRSSSAHRWDWKFGTNAKWGSKRNGEVCRFIRYCCYQPEGSKMWTWTGQVTFYCKLSHFLSLISRIFDGGSIPSFNIREMEDRKCENI